MENKLSPRAEELLGYIQKYRWTYHVSVRQYSHLMRLSRQKTIKYLNELVEKNKIRIEPESRRAGRGRTNRYILVEEE